MLYPAKRNPTQLLIYHEGRKRRISVARLSHDPEKNQFILTYDHRYRFSKNAISLGPKLSLLQETHYSENGKLFAFFEDRIPDRENPAYPDYCASQNIAVNEENPIILLGTIGKRGPSSFVFESVYETAFSAQDIVTLRQQLQLTQYDFSLAFDISLPTLQRLETGKSIDPASLKLIEVFFNFPEVALWQLTQTAGRLHREAKNQLIQYFLDQLRHSKK